MAEEYLTDDEQLEAVKKWIAENGLWMLSGAVLGAALLFGWRFYQSHQSEVQLKAAAQFGDMTGALERNDRNGSRRIADGIIKDFPQTPYADQAQLTIARLYVDDGQLPSAIAPLTQVMTGSKDEELRHIARLRLARILIDQGKPDEAIAKLAEVKPGAFEARYHEVRGDAFFAKKDTKNALSEYQAALGANLLGGSDTALLQLKITDLGVQQTAQVAVPAAGAPAGAALNQVKP